MKGIEFTQSQIKALENGATLFIFAIHNQELYRCAKYKEEFIKNYSPIQKGEKFFVQEEFVYHFDPMTQICGDIYYKAEEPDIMSVWKQASQMPYEHSRFKDLECVDVRVVRVHDIDLAKNLHKLKFELEATGGLSYSFQKTYNQQMEEQNINRTYEDNDYVFLVEIKRWHIAENY